MTHSGAAGAALKESTARLEEIAELVRRLPDLRRAAGTPYVGDTMMLDLDQRRAEDAERAGG